MLFCCCRVSTARLPEEAAINPIFVISSVAESSVYGRFCGVEKPAFRSGGLDQSFSKSQE